MGFLKNITLNNNAIDFSIDSLLKVGNYIYGFGKFSRIVNSLLKFHGIIVKLNSEGEVIWSKLYLDNDDLGDKGFNFNNAFTDTSNNLYVWGINNYNTLSTSEVNKTSSSYSDIYTITKLNQEGNLIWHKKFILNSYTTGIFKKIDNNNLLFATTNNDGYIELSKIDASTGNIVLSNQVNFVEPNINIENINIDVYSNKIFLVGNKNVNEIYKGVCYVIDNNFNLVDYIEISHPDKSFRLSEIDITEVDLQICGYTENETFFGIANYLPDYNYNTQNVLSFKKITGLFSLQKINTAIYLWDSYSNVIELDTSFSFVERTKKINFMPETIIPDNSFRLDTFLITRRNLIGSWNVFSEYKSCFITDSNNTYNVFSQNINLVKYNINDYAFLSNSNSHVFTSPMLQIENGQHTLDDFCKVVIVGRQVNTLIFNKDSDINQVIGSIQIENKGTGSYNFVKGQLIASGNGLEFFMDEAANLGEYGSISVIIRAVGKPLNLGDFSLPINIDSVYNPFEYDIEFSVILDSNPVIYIKEDNTSVPPLLKGIQVTNLNIGNLKIQNTTNSTISVSSGTIIAQANGLYFSLKDNTTFAAGSTTDVIILANGIPETEGNFSSIIFLYEVQNPNNFAIEFNVTSNIMQIDLNGANLQSPEFFMQAVGSNGINETKGIHLRWEFGGELGENHIPKGNLATSLNFYNKPNDFVNVCRVPYNKVSHTIDFTKSPDFINPLKYYWIYKYADNRSIYVYFKNKTLFRKALSQVSPQTNPIGFIQAYGGIIEIENKKDLFFGAELEISNKNENSSLQLEGLSLAKRDTYNSKVLSYRKLFKSSDLNAITSLRIENGRSLRFRVKDCQISKINFEYYSDFITEANKTGWEVLGTYSLSLDDNLVFSRLEPNITDNRVHGRWKKYNDEQYVNINNYKHKWNVDPAIDDSSWERSIKKTVEKYIELSEIEPKATEVFNFNQVEPNDQNDEDGNYQSYPEENNEVSNLDLLKLAALDFHVARMLGMGTMDLNPEVFSNEYVYLAVYDWKTNPNYYGYETSFNSDTGTLGIGLNLLDYTEGEVSKTAVVEQSNVIKLISMSLPSSINEERNPLSVDISEIKFGLPTENPEKSDLYDENGYTKDGKKRVVSIYAKESFKYEVYPPFFDSFKEFDASKFTVPIYAGLEHRHYVNAQNPIIWQTPELSHDTDYFIYGSETIGETLPIFLAEEDKALYVHFHNLKGKYFYASYGIDWFSRASVVSNDPTSEQVKVVVTDLKPANTLLPPTGVNCQLIKEENPLMFTSVNEQNRLKAIPESSDNTLVRLLFEYNAEQDIKIYNVDTENEPVFPDNEEVFADHIEIFYRSFTPKNITAKVTSLTDLPNNLLLMQVSTNSYTMASTGEIYESKYPSGTSATNFVGGIFLMNQQAYVIDSIETGTKDLKFNIYKKEASDLLLSGKYSDLSATTLKNKLLLEITQFTNASDTVISDGMFVATENMQTPSNWGVKNPNQLKVKLGNADWSVNRELITITSEDGNTQKFIEKTRGFWEEAIVTEFMEDHALINDEGKYIDEDGAIVSNPVVKKIHKGIYKIEFNNFKLPQHEQFSSDSKSVEWFNGFVRLFKTSDIDNDKFIETRTSLKVFKTENIGDSTKNLILYVIDENFKFDYKTGSVLNPNLNREFLLGNNVLINYYPSYRVYLYSDTSNDLTKSKVYGDKDVNYSIFGLRSIDTLYKDNNNLDYASRFCPPSILLAQKTIVPQKPKQPKGAFYTTRPDFYGKATYTFQVEFEDNPFAVQFYRADDNTLLNALYTRETIEYINYELERRGGKNEIAFAERWQDFLNYSEDKIQYEPLPHLGKWEWPLPQPDNKELYDSINYFIQQHNKFYKLTESDNRLLTEEDLGTLSFEFEVIKEVPGKTKPLYFRDFVKEYLYSAFLPLTEVPVVYNQIYGGDYIPTNKKQNLRDKDGVLLNPKSTQKDANGFLIKVAGDEFEMAPMMKGIGSKKVSFTDFTIDATTDSFYFYVAREIGSTMKLGEFSPVIGPVKVVDANTPEAPKINSALPVLSNSVLGINPKIKIEIHAYPEVQKIKRVNLYRTTERINAQAIMHMDLVKTIDISDVSLDDSNIWTIYDEFDSFDKVPYGEAIYYRITVEKHIEYAKADYITGGETPEVIIDYVPSQPSKIISTLIVENQTPESPNPKFVTDEVLENATTINYGALTWVHTLYRGKYHVYKMSEKGNWSEIAKLEINSNNPNQFTLYRLDNGNWNKIEDLEAKSNDVFITLSQLNLLPLKIKDSQGNNVYHHFKIIAENNSNMLSIQENILTIFNSDNTVQLDGISSDGIDGMITNQTFIIR